MGTLDRLAACEGRWQGSNRLHDPHTGQPEDSASAAVLTTLLGGRFVHVDYDWSYQGAGQKGSILIGGPSDPGSVTAHWIDSWHMSEDVMTCAGAVEGGGDVDVRGSYPAPPGPDWGWRIVVRPVGGTELHITMYNVTPDGDEQPAVEARYSRSPLDHG